ncbi:hypothetical protein [Streptomyces sp. JJ38]|uniref:hypothetical protein n=1 Tax=Streptomyces sp. JJ38 TaxID=2738128 RepID=UPI001C566006|nr:hypothetical protein [Streptomyces sp. JJ38]MBW1597505.1 hypothetical protein [Streptomyces sp. JJ38]
MRSPDSEYCVSVHLTGCGHETASAVFGALETAYPEGCDPTPRAARGTAEAEHHVVWTSTVDTETPRSGLPAVPVPLDEDVAVEIHGAADPVRRVHEVLMSAFVSEDHGTVPGEHELETRLRLTATRRPVG